MAPVMAQYNENLVMIFTSNSNVSAVKEAWLSNQRLVYVIKQGCSVVIASPYAHVLSIYDFDWYLVVRLFHSLNRETHLAAHEQFCCLFSNLTKKLSLVI